MDACKLLVHTLVMVRLDYCNALLCGAREDIIRQLERLQRQAARVVCKKYKNDHTSVTELMWGLHWLPIRARIQHKILVLVYKAFTNGSPTYLSAPTYLSDMMTSCNPVRSTADLLVSTVYIFPFQNGVYLAIYTCLFRWCYGHFYNRLTQFIVYCSYVVCTILLRRPVDLSTHWTVTAISLHVTTFVGVCHE